MNAWREGRAEREAARIRLLLASAASDRIAAQLLFGCKVAECCHCGMQFLTGPKTGRRSSVKYCRSTHRVAAARLKKRRALKAAEREAARGG